MACGGARPDADARSGRARGCRDEEADSAGCALSDLFDDEADRFDDGAHPDRAGQDAPVRPYRRIRFALRSDACADAERSARRRGSTDHRGRSADAPCRFHVRVHRGLSRREVLPGRGDRLQGLGDACRDDGAARETAARVPPRHAIPLQRVHRRARAHLRTCIGSAHRRIAGTSHLRAARHERHRVLSCPSRSAGG